MTRSDHPSGSDRIHEALGIVGGRADIVVNVHGDLPTLSSTDLRAALGPLTDPAVHIATIAAEIRDQGERDDPNVVKVVGSPVAGSLGAGALGAGAPPSRLRALYFTRATAPDGDGPLYHHIGLYAYRRAALERFVRLPPSWLEQRERLEQLRALEAGMRIDVAIVQSVPLGVDTPEDLERARALLSGRPPVAMPSVGRIVCSCFQVGRNRIVEAVRRERIADVAALGRRLQCGTNCGSCLPELREIIADERRLAAE